MDNNRTYTFIDLDQDLLKIWRQDNCEHNTIDYTRTFTNNGRDFWADGECFYCGKKTGGRIYWSTK
jgi:hypothetical protein